MLLRRSRSSKVIEVGTNRKPVCDFLLVIVNDNLSRTVSELSQLIVQILDTAFLSHPSAGLGTMYDVHLGSLESA